MTTKIVESIQTRANGYGQVVAQIVFVHSLSESDNRPEFNIGARWGNLRKRARRAIVDFIVEREQKTTETRDEARKRISASLGNIEVAASDLDAMNRWWGVSFQEPRKDA